MYVVEKHLLVAFGILLGVVILVIHCLEKCGDVLALVLLLEVIPIKIESERGRSCEIVVVFMAMLGLLCHCLQGSSASQHLGHCLQGHHQKNGHG